ncbi:hypothetical protein ACH5RR_023949 [Cinchona calisaya]|uniref:Cytochrome P450 n=1 Tax=Cinchona calisaya TaxID=153742 RepID=A0ABD2ZC29_9GENT
MDFPILLLIILLFLVIWYYSSCRKSDKLPPGPNPFPIVGNIFQLNGIIHESLSNLSQIYGPLMSLKLGKKTIIVVSSAEVAKELLQKNDLKFSSIGVPNAAQALEHHMYSAVWLPVEKQWQNLRKLCKEQMFSSERLNASEVLRQEKVQQLCKFVQECCINCERVDIG